LPLFEWCDQCDLLGALFLFSGAGVLITSLGLIFTMTFFLSAGAEPDGVDAVSGSDGVADL
jgi:hypothetical protein